MSLYFVDYLDSSFVSSAQHGFLSVTKVLVKICHGAINPCYSPETDHWCTAPEKWNLNSQEIWRNISSPRGFMEGCYQFDVDFDSYENIQQAIGNF